MATKKKLLLKCNTIRNEGENSVEKWNEMNGFLYFDDL